eukprot:3722129-Heterocapsa_arctica.AAC.1
MRMHPMHQAECRIPAVESLRLAAMGRKHRGIDDVYGSGSGGARSVGFAEHGGWSTVSPNRRTPC